MARSFDETFEEFAPPTNPRPVAGDADNLPTNSSSSARSGHSGGAGIAIGRSTRGGMSSAASPWSPTPMMSTPSSSPVSPGGNTLYWSLDLTPESRELLAASPFLQSCSEPARTASGHWCPPLALKGEFHVTALFVGGRGEHPEEGFWRGKEGQRVTIECLGFLRCASLAALSVRVADPAVGSRIANLCPHITLALGDGVPAVNSNYRLEEYGDGRLSHTQLVSTDSTWEGLCLEGCVTRHTAVPHYATPQWGTPKRGGWRR